MVWLTPTRTQKKYQSRSNAARPSLVQTRFADLLKYCFLCAVGQSQVLLCGVGQSKVLLCAVGQSKVLLCAVGQSKVLLCAVGQSKVLLLRCWPIKKCGADPCCKRVFLFNKQVVVPINSDTLRILFVFACCVLCLVLCVLCSHRLMHWAREYILNMSPGSGIGGVGHLSPLPPKPHEVLMAAWEYTIGEKVCTCLLLVFVGIFLFCFFFCSFFFFAPFLYTRVYFSCIFFFAYFVACVCFFLLPFCILVL